ncbi:radical SAM protein [Nonomuraea sp. NPDC050478]|uniref:radical SAM protein n=1 Tax=Nonomuraea sp. NPDC050478 TaxID=3364365 RepID=UPI0037995032
MMTAELAIETAWSPAQAPVRFLELELTNRCQLSCTHCYALSAPTDGHGEMTLPDWKRLLDDAPAAGVSHVQLIGGEPTLQPDFALLLTHALDRGLKVEVFSNLLHITEPLWDLLTRPGVELATSYYSDTPIQHDRITGRLGSHRRTRAAISEALRRGIPLRAGIIDLGDGQRVEQARTELERLGVTRVRVDRMRGVGRAAEHRAAQPTVRELCGRCGDGRAAVSCGGDVRLCVLSRFLPSAGNVRTTPLADILAGRKWRELCAKVPRRRTATACNPDSDGNDCAPAETIYDPDKATGFLRAGR